jgi:dolichyl-phosphate-mannose--protein O-mannosyl transferase
MVASNKQQRFRMDVIFVVVLSALAFATRFGHLSHPNEIVFDEQHFGKFISSYITGKYYFDIHPPLGKMMIAAVGYLAGYNVCEIVSPSSHCSCAASLAQKNVSAQPLQR